MVTTSRTKLAGKKPSAKLTNYKNGDFVCGIIRVIKELNGYKHHSVYGNTTGFVDVMVRFFGNGEPFIMERGVAESKIDRFTIYKVQEYTARRGIMASLVPYDC